MLCFIYNFRTCLELSKIWKELGLPSSVLNTLTGLCHEAGAPFNSHPDVDKVQLSLALNTFDVTQGYILVSVSHSATMMSLSFQSYYDLMTNI